MFENKKQQLAPRPIYLKRMAKSFMTGMAIITVCLLIGVFGYHYTAGIAWLDSLHNASMILSGMGPVVEIRTVTGKLFSSIYALFSGIIFISTIGLILAPTIHRFFHKIHLESGKN
jgi:hypothetical protein